MHKAIEALRALRRPRLLIRAARHGALEYNRNRDLRRIIKSDVLPGPGVTVPRLMDMEAQIDAMRCAGDRSYSIVRHVDVLIALMAESRLLA